MTSGLILGILGIILAATAPQYKAQFFLLGLLTLGITAHKAGYRIEEPQLGYPYQQVDRLASTTTPAPVAMPSIICDQLDAVATAGGSVSQTIIEAGNFNEIRLEINQNCAQHMAALEAATSVLFSEPDGSQPMYLDNSAPFYELHPSRR